MNNNIILNKEENLKDINSTIKDIQNLFNSIETYIIPNITIRNTADKIVNIVGELTKLVDIVNTSKELIDQTNAVIAASIGVDYSKIKENVENCSSDYGYCSSDYCDSDYCDSDGCGSDYGYCSSDYCDSDGCDSYGCGSDCGSDYGYCDSDYCDSDGY